MYSYFACTMLGECSMGLCLGCIQCYGSTKHPHCNENSTQVSDCPNKLSLSVLKETVNSKLEYERIVELVGLLNSPQTGDEISAGVVEIVGFDEIELGMELVQSRDLIAQQVSWV